LGVTEVSADEFYAAFEANPEIKFNLGKQLGINGYIDVVDNIKITIDKNYHADYEASIEHEVEDNEELDQEALQQLRNKMEANIPFNVPDTDAPEDTATSHISAEDEQHIMSVIEDIDSKEPEKSDEEFVSQNE
jgi:hypothetical protein